MKPTYARPIDNRNMVFYDMLNNNEGFAILSSKKLPQIPNFPIFMNVGELKVDVRVNKEIQNLDGDQINALKMFHSLIFNEILAVTKEFMVFDSKNMENSFLIVPSEY